MGIKQWIGNVGLNANAAFSLNLLHKGDSKNRVVASSIFAKVAAFGIILGIVKAVTKDMKFALVVAGSICASLFLLQFLEYCYLKCKGDANAAEKSAADSSFPLALTIAPLLLSGLVDCTLGRCLDSFKCTSVECINGSKGRTA